MQQIRKDFTEQFEPDGDGYLYRKHRRGAPIRVTKAERDQFVAEFERRVPYALGGSILASMLVILAPLVLFPSILESDFQIIVVGAAVILSFVPFILVMSQLLSNPARALNNRLTSGAPRTRAELSRLLRAKQTYGEIAAVAIAAPFPLLQVDWGNDLFTGSNLAWLAFSAFLVAAVIFALWRKWKLDQENK